MIGRDLRDRRLMIAVVGPAGMLVAGAFADHRSTAAAYLVAWLRHMNGDGESETQGH